VALLLQEAAHQLPLGRFVVHDQDSQGIHPLIPQSGILAIRPMAGQSGIQMSNIEHPKGTRMLNDERRDPLHTEDAMGPPRPRAGDSSKFVISAKGGFGIRYF
jgi:hypothetical protein